MKRMLSGGRRDLTFSPSWARLAFLLKTNPLIGGAYHIIPWNFIGLATPKEDWISHRGRGRRGFAAALAAGAALTPREDLVEALFGEMQKISLFASFGPRGHPVCDPVRFFTQGPIALSASFRRTWLPRLEWTLSH